MSSCFSAACPTHAGETDDVNKVQLDIREGHAQTVDKVLKWLDEEGGVQNITVADAGCGTGRQTLGLQLVDLHPACCRNFPAASL